MFKVVGGPGVDSFFFTVGSLFALGKKKGSITRYTLEGKTFIADLPLKLPPLPKDMPIDAALYREKTVKWLLNNGYVPQLLEDRGGSIALVQQTRSEQSLEIQVLLSEFVRLNRVINRFLKCCEQRDRYGEITGEEFQEWHQLYESDKKGCRDKLDLVVLLLEEGRQALRNNDFPCVQECLIAATSLVPESFGIKGLYGDFLAFRGDRQASKYFLELSWNKSGKDSVTYLEKALRVDPEDKEVQANLEDIKCSQEWALHLRATAYLACHDKSSDVAAKYLKSATMLNRGIGNGAVSILSAQKKIEDAAARSCLESSQTWKVGESIPLAPPSTPKSPRLGFGRSSQGKKNTVRNQEGSAQKRKFLAKKADMQTLEGLLWWYEGKEKWLKAEYVARYFLSQIAEGQEKRYTIGACLAKVLEKQARKDEAAKVYFELAKQEYQQGIKEDSDGKYENAKKRYANAKEALELLATNLGAFTAQERRVIHLLLLELKSDVTTPRLQKAVEQEIKHAPQKISAEWSWFEIDHPDYVACAYTPTSQFLFRKRTVEVISLEEEGKRIFALELPQNTIPDECMFFAKKRIMWLLANGYIPEISSSGCTFSLPSTNRLIERLAMLEGEEVKQAKIWLEKGAFVLAYYYMQKAFRNGPRTEELQALYAEVALLVKKPELAYQLFTNLEPTPTNLERALKAASAYSDDLAEGVYKKILAALSKSRASEIQLQIAALHAYHYFQERNPLFASRFSNKANGLVLLWAKLAGRSDPAERKGLYQELADMTCYEYYKTKKALADPVFTPTTLDRERHDMEVFVQSAEFQKEIESVRRYVTKTKDPLLAELLEACRLGQYERAEKAFLRAKEEYVITQLQNYVMNIYKLWMAFTRTLTHTDNESIASFFLAKSNQAFIDALKDHEPRLKDALEEQEYLAAKDLLLELHTDHEATEIQQVIKRLYIAYINTPPPLGWRRFYDQLFTSSEIPLESSEEGDSAFHLIQAQEAKGKLMKSGNIVHNSICMEVSSLGLYHLECALSLAQTHKVYKAIAKKLHDRSQTSTLFLLCLHAFFSLRDQNEIEHANEFLTEAERLNPENILFLTAKIEQLPFWAKSEKGAIFSKIARILESKELREQYLEAQGSYVVSSLEPMVKARCLTILEEVDAREKRRATIVAVDTLMENGCLGPIPGLLSDLKNDAKRCFVLAIKENKPLGALKALRTLSTKYEQKSLDKKAAVVRLLEKRDKRRSSDQTTDALFDLFQAGRKGEAAKRLQALKELDPTFGQQNPDDKLMLELLEKQLSSLNLE